MLSMQKICRFGNTNPSKNNYREAERILKTTNHLFACGKDQQQHGSLHINVIAKCLSLSNLRGKMPLDISGTISNLGIIEKMHCSYCCIY